MNVSLPNVRLAAIGSAIALHLFTEIEETIKKEAPRLEKIKTIVKNVGIGMVAGYTANLAVAAICPVASITQSFSVVLVTGFILHEVEFEKSKFPKRIVPFLRPTFLAALFAGIALTVASTLILEARYALVYKS